MNIYIVTQVAQITHLVQDNTLCCIAYTEGVKLFCGKFYTGQKKFTQAPPVVPVTNMRYANPPHIPKNSEFFFYTLFFELPLPFKKSGKEQFFLDEGSPNKLDFSKLFTE